jgi:hypothetical protein
LRFSKPSKSEVFDPPTPGWGGGVENRAFGGSQGVPRGPSKSAQNGVGGFLKKVRFLKRPVFHDCPAKNPIFSRGGVRFGIGQTSENPVFLAFAVLPPYPPGKSAPKPVLGTF